MPGDTLGIGRDRVAGPRVDPEEQQHDRSGAGRVGTERQRRKRIGIDGDRQLLAQLAHQCRLGRLTRLDLAAGKLPQAAMRTAGAAALHQNAAVRRDQRRGDDEQRGYARAGLDLDHSLTGAPYAPTAMRSARLVIKLRAEGARLLRDRRAATAVEYGLIVSLIVIVMIASFRLVADQTVSMWGNVQTTVSNATGH